MLLAVLALVVRRALGNWRLLAVVTAGVVFAAALTSSTAIYADAIRDLGLSHALRGQPQLSLDTIVTSTSARMAAAEDASRRQNTQGIAHAYAGHWLSGPVEYGRSATFYLSPPGQPAPVADNRPRSFLQYQDGLADHVRVTDGALTLHTDPAADPKQPPTVQAVIGKVTADRLKVKVGDRFDLHPYWHLEMAPISVVVAGIIEPKDANEEYWMGKSDRFELLSQSWDTYPFFVDRDTLEGTVAAYLPDIEGDFTTLFPVKASGINADNATRALNGFDGMEAQLRAQIPRTTINTVVPETISTYQSKLFFSRLPLFALMLQVVGIVLYYIVMVSTMLVDRQAGEVALLKSRGASTRQIVGVYAIEGGIIALLGGVLGPVLAAATIRLLGPTPPFHDLSGGALLRTHISTQAWLLAALGAGLSLAALLWPAYRASRYSIVGFKQALSRPPRTPAFFRYYLDVFLIVVAAVLFYELRQRGSLVTQQLFGNLKTDPLLLVTPTLFMLTIALLFLRLFPLALRLVARLFGEVSGPSVLLGLWHMVRSPVHYSRLILLLILATSLGMFAAGFRATLDRSYRDRAAYQAGADLRAEGVREPLPLSGGDLAAKAQQALGAAAVSSTVRENGSYSPKQFQQVDAQLLGIDPASFDSVAYWRDDFSGHSLKGMTSALAKSRPVALPGLLLPDGARAIGVWVQGSAATQPYQIAVRLVDASGRIVDYQLSNGRATQPPPGQWTFLSARLDQPGAGFTFRPGPPPAQPLRFIALYTRSRPIQTAETVQDYFDDLQVSTDTALQAAGGFANGTVVTDFEDTSGFELVGDESTRPTGDSFGRSDKAAHGGQFSGLLTWTHEAIPVHGARMKGDGQPVAGYASQEFMKAAGLHSGQTILMYIDRAYVDVRIAGSFSYFPTYTPGSGQNLLVVDMARLQYATMRVPEAGDGTYANGVWARGPDPSIDSLTALRRAGLSADEISSVAELRASQQRDPLVAASWEGILFLSFAAVLLLAALGFVVYSLLSARAQALEFAVLRTMGLSRRQIVFVVSFEQLFVTVAGVLAGTILGFPLSRLMIGYMGITETGSKVVPPFVSSVSWQAVASTYVGLAIVFAGATAALATLYARLAVSRALRLGEG
ncbi:MAG TPA: ABC transporter permease [Dehalococcoidia bacterium]|nr:ABC transporter permease [Dehalococcoidia bacterium]